MGIRSGSEILQDILSTTDIVRLRWDLVPEEITSLATATIERSRKVHDAVAAAASQPTWESTLGSLAEDDVSFEIASELCSFPSHVSTDKAIRDASSDADKQLRAYSVEAGSRHDVYLAVLAYEQTEHAKSLTGEARRFLEHTLRNFRRKGLQLDGPTRDKVKQINTRMSELSVQFSKNLGEVTTKLPFTREQLEGLPDDFFEGRNKSEDGQHYLVTLKYPDYFPVMKLCKVDATRKTMATAYDQQCMAENGSILEELVALRHEAAQLLGYPTHSAFKTEILMSKAPEAVTKFLQDLSDKLTPLFREEMVVLLDLKKKEKEARGEEHDGRINSWDLTYYRNMVEERNYQVDHQKIKEYFPLEKVTHSLLGIYQELLGLHFEPDAALTAAAWHPEVKAFKVSDSKSGEVLGFFYMDMHPREGKYGHAAVFGLQPGCKSAISASGRLLPTAACVCNFPKPTPERPALLPHDDVETFFHEFGHVMHQICARADFAMFAGTAVERDFVEAPSQMLENWVWEEAALTRMSGHYQHPEQTLPAELLKPLIKARNANAGIINKRQVLLGMFDQYIHTQPHVDTAKEWARLMHDIMGIDPILGTNFAANFGHLAGGYDAQYYGYLWSEVFSADMFETVFKKGGIFSEDVGRKYREAILKPGGSRDATVSLVEFLGRDPSIEPFLRSKGLSSAAH